MAAFTTAGAALDGEAAAGVIGLEIGATIAFGGVSAFTATGAVLDGEEGLFGVAALTGTAAALARAGVAGFGTAAALIGPQLARMGGTAALVHQLEGSWNMKPKSKTSEELLEAVRGLAGPAAAEDGFCLFPADGEAAVVAFIFCGEDGATVGF